MIDLPKAYKPARFTDVDYERASKAVYLAAEEGPAAELSNMLSQAGQEQRRLVHLVAKGTARRKALRQLNAAYVSLDREYAMQAAELDMVRRQRDELYLAMRSPRPEPLAAPAGRVARWWPW